MSSLDDLKNKVKLYFGEETILRNHNLSPEVPQSDVNLRKSTDFSKQERKISSENSINRNYSTHKNDKDNREIEYL